MKEINVHNEEYFKSVWLPLIISFTFSCIQSADLASAQIFFDIDYVQIIDTFIICIYATITPAGIIYLFEKNSKIELKYIIISFLGIGLYLLYSFVFEITYILLFSLMLGIFSYYKFRSLLIRGESK